MRWVVLIVWVGSLWAQEPYDLLIRNGKVVDGAGNPWIRGDVAVRGERIVHVGPLPDSQAKRVIDAKGMVVAPGFIDIHNHGARGLFVVPTAEPYLRQGVTSLLEGNDGSSPHPLHEFLARLAKQPKSVNMGLFVGHGTLRTQVMGLVNRPSTPQELDRMKGLAEQAMQAGAFGLSTGLFYVPGNYAKTEEVVEIAKVVGRYGGMHISHMRNEAEGAVESVRETIRIGEEGGLPTQVSHHKIIGRQNWGKSKETLQLVQEARARGVDVTIDQYPYTASSTGTGALFPQWSLEGGNKSLVERLSAPERRAEIKTAIVRNIIENRGGGDPKNVVIASCGFDSALAGKSLADLARERGQPPTPENAAEIAMELQKAGGCSAVYHAIAEEDVERIMQAPDTMIASDGGISVFGAEAPHPRNYGTFPRVLGRYVRERKIITLEDAIRRMTSLPAQRLRLADRGLLRPGMQADIVVFNAEQIGDRADFANPHQYSVGMEYVVVNGGVVLDAGKVTAARPGQVLYGPAKMASPATQQPASAKP